MIAQEKFNDWIEAYLKLNDNLKEKISLSDIADSLPMIDYITPNLTESEFYTGKKQKPKSRKRL